MRVRVRTRMRERERQRGEKRKKEREQKLQSIANIKEISNGFMIHFEGYDAFLVISLAKLQDTHYKDATFEIS